MHQEVSQGIVVAIGAGGCEDEKRFLEVGQGGVVGAVADLLSMPYQEGHGVLLQHHAMLRQERKGD